MYTVHFDNKTLFLEKSDIYTFLSYLVKPLIFPSKISMTELWYFRIFLAFISEK